MDQGQAGTSPIPPARISQSASRMSVGWSDLQHPAVDPALLAAASRGRIAKREHNGWASDAPSHGEEANWILERENEPYSNRFGCRYAVQISEKFFRNHLWPGENPIRSHVLSQEGWLCAQEISRKLLKRTD